MVKRIPRNDRRQRSPKQCREKTYFAAGLNIFQKVKRASRGSKHPTRQWNSGDANFWGAGGVFIYGLCGLSHAVFFRPSLSRLSEPCWSEARDVTGLERTPFPSVLSGHVGKDNLLLAPHSPPRPARHFSGDSERTTQFLIPYF